MILLDTSFLIDSLTGARSCVNELRMAIEKGERIVLPAVVLYEWLRGRPRLPAEIAAQEALFPSDTAIAFGPREAAVSAVLYRSLPRARGREIDLTIAATAIVRNANLWTRNPSNFADIPDLRLL